MARILVVDDETSMLQMLSQLLADMGHEVRAASSGRKALDAMADFAPHLVLADLRMEGVGGLDVLKSARKRHPGVPIVIMSAYSEFDTAVEAVRAGAADYLPKPFKIEDLRLKVELALKSRVPPRRAPAASPEKGGFRGVLGESDAMKAVFETMRKAAEADCPVLISGESGTGKEFAARAVHNAGARQKKPFLPINCSALPETLLDSEIFGHRRGSFPNAFSDKKGMLEEAEGGTLFLDEIGSLSMTLQSKLFRFLEDAEFRRLGESGTRRANVRIMASTNEDLRQKTRLGSFRRDLYYRLAVILIDMPPLRLRLADVPLLAGHFVRAASAALGIAPPAISAEAVRLFQTYAWPGNVRELQNAAERAVAMSDRRKIEAKDLPGRIRSQETPEEAAALAIRPLKEAVREYERDYCLKALRLSHGDRRAAAHMLRISLPSFYRKLPPSEES